MKLVKNISNYLIISCFGLLTSACNFSANRQANAAHTPYTSDSAIVRSEPAKNNLISRLQHVETLILVPRVSGYIQQVHVKNGSTVAAGQLLFELDPEPFNTEIRRLRAQLRQTQTAARLARIELEQAGLLLAQQKIDVAQFKQINLLREHAGNQVRAASAELQQAQLLHSYTRIKAPVSGQVSFTQLLVGSYVIGGQTQITRLIADTQPDTERSAQPDYDALQLRSAAISKPSTRLFVRQKLHGRREQLSHPVALNLPSSRYIAGS